MAVSTPNIDKVVAEARKRARQNRHGRLSPNEAEGYKRRIDAARELDRNLKRGPGDVMVDERAMSAEVGAGMRQALDAYTLKRESLKRAIARLEAKEDSDEL